MQSLYVLQQYQEMGIYMFACKAPRQKLFTRDESVIWHAEQKCCMSDETMTCICTDCSHELRTDCINMHCTCCSHQDAQDMVTHSDR